MIVLSGGSLPCQGKDPIVRFTGETLSDWRLASRPEVGSRQSGIRAIPIMEGPHKEKIDELEIECT